MLYFQDGPLTVRPLEQEDCEAVPRCFAAQGWEKPRALFRRYLEEQGRGERRGCRSIGRHPFWGGAPGLFCLGTLCASRA